MDLRKKIKGFFTLTRKANGGFTLVELIVVIAILAILAGIAVPVYSGYVKKADQAADEALLYEINLAFRAACVENLCDASDITKAAWDMTTMTVTSVEDDPANPIVASFGKYFTVANPKFTVIKGLYFHPQQHQFIDSNALLDGSSFGDEAVLATMNMTLDGISGYFSAILGRDLNYEDMEAWVTKGMTDELAAALGLMGMLDAYDSAMTMSDTELDALLATKIDNYANLAPEQKAAYRQTYRANLGVMYFAEDAATRDAASVMNSVGNFINIMMSGKFNSVDPGQLEAYYLATASAADVTYYNDHPAEREGILNTFASTEVIALSSDFKFTGAQAAAMALAAGDGANNAGVNTLGGMYALAAGYYNSSYYNPETDGTKPNSFGDFDSITKAMNNESFFAYIQEQGQADLEAYLQYMAYLAQNPDIDLTKDDAFAGLNGQD